MPSRALLSALLSAFVVALQAPASADSPKMLRTDPPIVLEGFLTPRAGGKPRAKVEVPLDRVLSLAVTADGVTVEYLDDRGRVQEQNGWWQWLQKVDGTPHRKYLSEAMERAVGSRKEYYSFDWPKYGLEQLALGLEHGGVVVQVLPRLGKIGARATRARSPRSSPRATPSRILNWPDTPVLNELGRNLNLEASRGKLAPFVGRTAELRLVIKSLVRRSKGPLLVGPPGVGKTSIPEGLAQLIESGLAPEELANKRIVQIRISDLSAGTRYRGDLEAKAKALLNEIANHRDELIVFMDEAHLLVGAGRSTDPVDLANLFKPALANGDLRAILATTVDEVEAFDADPALKRRFIPVMVNPSSVSDTVAMLKGARRMLQTHYKVRMNEAALEAAAELGERVPERFLPDAAFDLLESAAAEQRLSGRRTLGRAAVEKEFRDTTGMEPVARAGSARVKRLGRMEQLINDRVIGQPEAAKALTDAAFRVAAGLNDSERTNGSYFFVGGTGNGKTLTARTLAEVHYGSPDALIKINMNEFTTAASMESLLLQVTRAVRRRPYAVVLLDELERAHPDAQELILQVLEDGQLTDRKGRTVSFRDSTIVITSNAEMTGRQRLGFGDQGNANVRSDRRRALARTFHPALVNRVHIIEFRPLEREDVGRIVDLEIRKVRGRLKKQGGSLSITAAARAELVTLGYDRDFGARPLRDAIELSVENPLARLQLTGGPGKYRVDVRDGQIVVDRVPSTTETPKRLAQGVSPKRASAPGNRPAPRRAPARRAAR